MPSPFPGMDPYLEGPLWSMVHNSLIEEFARQLTPKLWPRYKVRPGERVVVSPPDPIESVAPRERLPDVALFKTEGGSLPVSLDRPSAIGSAPIIRELLESPPPVVQTFIEIRSADGSQLVTAIEVLSPTNKRGSGAAEFALKRREVLASDAHFLEIDMLRDGERFPVSGPLPSVPYFVFLSRAELRPRIEIWPIPLDAPLPSVAVPLLAPDPDVILEMQLALQTVYDLYHYDADIDYSQPAPLPLSGEQADWADKLLRSSGRR